MGAPSEEFGPYVVYEQIGLGGMATVHRAETQGIAGFSKQVALKRMLPNVASDANLVKSFIREARLASHLRHANVAQTYDLGKVGETYFIAMELVPGRNLREILKHCAAVVGHMPMPIALNIVGQICDALDYAHNLCDETGQPLGIIHRDVSPSNIIVSEGGTVKLIDFGIAKASGRGMHTQTGTIKGKFGYMAPEYLMGHIDARADLFAIGVIAHELLANRPLFQGKDDMDTLYRVKDMPILAPSRINPKVPPEIDAIIMTALERDPDHRWQRANAIRQALSTEIKRCNLVAHNAEVIEWVDWAFAQSNKKSDFDVMSEPMISISSGTMELPAGTAPGRNLARQSEPVMAQREREVPDDFQHADGMETMVRPSKSKPIASQPALRKSANDVPTLQQPGNSNQWASSLDVTTPESSPHRDPLEDEWKAASVDVPTRLVRPSGQVRAPTPDPHLVDTRRDRSGPVPRQSSPHTVRKTPQPIRSMPDDDEDQIRTLPPRGDIIDDAAKTLPPRGGKVTDDAARTLAEGMRAQMDAATTDPLHRRPDRPSQPTFPEPALRPRTDRPSQPQPTPAHEARTLMIDPPRDSRPSQPQPIKVGEAQRPLPLTPPQRTLPGTDSRPPPQGLPPANVVVSGAKTAPHLTAAARDAALAASAQNAAPVLDNLDARGVRPAARVLQGTAATSSVVSKTIVEPSSRGGASNFLLAVLVLIAAGGAAAVVYFALPYLT